MAINYSQNFNFLPSGDLDSDGFYKAAGDTYPQVQEAVKFEGAKGVEGHYISGVYVSGQRDFAGTNNEDHWAKFALGSSDVTESFPWFVFGKTSALQAILVGFLDGYVKCYDGNGVGGGAWLSTGVAVVNGQFYVGKVKFDFATKKWVCWVSAAGGVGGMDTPKLTNLGFRHNTADSLNHLRFYLAQTPHPDAKYIDTLSINDYDPDLGKFDLLSNDLENNPLMGGGLLN